MSTQDDAFLSRWSRRKLAAGQADKARPAVPGHDADAEEPGKVADEDPSERALTPEEIAALPKIEDLTPESDITVYLRKGVPEVLKNAALRRIWALDPAIRDYVGDARDYAYDWNVPGSVPGNGPLRPTDDVGAMLREMFRDGPAELEERVSGESPENSAPQKYEVELSPDRVAGADDNRLMNVINAPQHEDALPGPGPVGTDDAETPRIKAEQSSGEDDVAPQSSRPPAAAPPRSRRRHGGAKPV